MREDKTEPDKFAELRRRAEEAARGKPEDLDELSPEDIHRLIHELRVHQIELEMQNEELRRAQQELEESRDRYSDLYDFAPVGYFTVDENGLILEANLTGANLLGVERAFLIGRPLSRFVARDDHDAFFLHHKQVFAAKARQTCEIRLVRKNGAQSYAQLESIVMQDHDGNFSRYRTIISDIAERKRAEEALKESERLEEMVEQRTKELRDAQEQLIRQEKLAALGQLAGGVGHELRNPLGAIKNASYFLNMALENPEPEVKETLEILEKEVRTSERIISSLLDFARSKPAVWRKVDVNSVVRETLSRFAVSKNIQLVCQLDEALPTIMADPDQLSQVFGNIILNAIQAMPEGGQLVVKSGVEDPEILTVSFTDTGVGISRKNLKKVFGPLFTTKAKGIGLGLPISKTLAEGHGGTIEVQSEVGKGSTFAVKLPIRKVGK
jgi:PAS domain S-box-containing protein